MYEKDGENRKSTSIIAEKVTFLSSSNKEKDDVEKSNDDDLDM